MADVRLYQSDDDGEIDFVAGQLTMADGLETSAYLSLFGGNERDSGLTDGEALQWWANFEEPVAERRQRSQLQALLQQIPATPANLRRVEDAALADLAWMGDALDATVAVEASMPALDTVSIHVSITIGNTTYEFDFASTWGGNQQ
jgi:phage gp46-like protein